MNYLFSAVVVATIIVATAPQSHAAPVSAFTESFTGHCGFTTNSAGVVTATCGSLGSGGVIGSRSSFGRGSSRSRMASRSNAAAPAVADPRRGRRS